MRKEGMMGSRKTEDFINADRPDDELPLDDDLAWLVANAQMMRADRDDHKDSPPMTQYILAAEKMASLGEAATRPEVARRVVEITSLLARFAEMSGATGEA